MSKSKIITIISIVLTAIVIAIGTILIINKNSQTTKAVIAEQTMGDTNLGESTDRANDDSTVNPTEETTPSANPSKNPSAKPKNTPTPVTSAGKYYIKVNNQMNTVTVYTKDQEGNYTVPVRAMVCSTGYASPKNSKYQLKSRWGWRRMLSGVYAQYATHITGEILFHSVPYYTANKARLEYQLYDKLGTTCSAGCIRLTTRDAKWIFDNCPAGTWVEFYSSSNPGPLGKPTAMKISGNTAYRNWDPTDPDPKNPWRNAGIEAPEPNEPTPEPTPTPTPEVPVVTPSEGPATPIETPTINVTNTPATTLPTVTPQPSGTPAIVQTPTTNTTPDDQENP